MTNPRNPPWPPIVPGPFLDAWQTPNAPQLTRPQLPNFPIQSAGGAHVPPDVPRFYSADFACILNGTLVFPVTTASQKIVDAPSSFRNYIEVRNSSSSATAVIFICFGRDAALSSTVRLAQNEIHLWDARVPQDDIYVIGNEAGQISVDIGVVALPIPLP